VLSCTLCLHTGADVSSLYTAYQVPAPCIAQVLTAVQLLTAASLQAILEADAIILGAPGRQGGMCGEMRLFLDTWAVHQTEQKIGFGALKVTYSRLPSYTDAFDNTF